MLTQLSTDFVARLKRNDEAAWFELWETFGPVIRAQLTKWGKGRIGPETVRDLSQETLAALSDSIDRYDPARGARFSTWLLAIAKHVLGDEIDRRNAAKRGSGHRGQDFDESWMAAAKAAPADHQYEAAVFRAKVEKAIRLTEKESDFLDFSIYRMRVLDDQPGKAVAAALGISEPTVSRRLAKVRDTLRARLREIVATYSFTQDEIDEPSRNGLDLNPTKDDDAAFDRCIHDIYHTQAQLRREQNARFD